MRVRWECAQILQSRQHGALWLWNHTSFPEAPDPWVSDSCIFILFYFFGIVSSELNFFFIVNSSDLSLSHAFHGVFYLIIPSGNYMFKPYVLIKIFLFFQGARSDFSRLESAVERSGVQHVNQNFGSVAPPPRAPRASIASPPALSCMRSNKRLLSEQRKCQVTTTINDAASVWTLSWPAGHAYFS